MKKRARELLKPANAKNNSPRILNKIQPGILNFRLCMLAQSNRECAERRFAKTQIKLKFDGKFYDIDRFHSPANK